MQCDIAMSRAEHTVQGTSHHDTVIITECIGKFGILTQFLLPLLVLGRSARMGLGELAMSAGAPFLLVLAEGG